MNLHLKPTRQGGACLLEEEAPRCEPQPQEGRLILFRKAAQQGPLFEGHILGCSPGGFRARHNLLWLKPQDRVEFDDGARSGIAIVTWHTPQGETADSSFLIIQRWSTWRDE